MFSLKISFSFGGKRKHKCTLASIAGVLNEAFSKHKKDLAIPFSLIAANAWIIFVYMKEILLNLDSSRTRYLWNFKMKFLAGHELH